MPWGEVHVFRGATFVTRGRFTTGVRVPDDASGEELGRPIIDFYASTSGKEGREAWQVFRAGVAGVPSRRYQPEKCARVFLSRGVWTVAASFDGQASITSEPPTGPACRIRGPVSSVCPGSSSQPSERMPLNWGFPLFGYRLYSYRAYM